MAAGLVGPLVDLPARLPGSVRRTMTFDTSHPEGMDGPLLIDGRGRDLFTPVASPPRVLAQWRVRAGLAGRSLRIAWLSCEPQWSFAEELVGSSASNGLRKRVRQAARTARGEEQLMVAMLDDLPGAALVGGYAAARSVPASFRTTREQFEMRLDVCAGWARGASMDAAFGDQGQMPLPGGVPLTSGADDDPLDWHAIDRLPATGMRRQRLIDLFPMENAAEAQVRIDTHFRDTYAVGNDERVAIHEYSASSEILGRPARLTRLSVVPRVLPWPECPSAVASAQQAVGEPIAVLREKMTGAFMGTSSCTHLTDTVRSLGHVEGLATWLAGPDPDGVDRGEDERR